MELLKYAVLEITVIQKDIALMSGSALVKQLQNVGVHTLIAVLRAQKVLSVLITGAV